MKKMKVSLLILATMSTAALADSVNPNDYPNSLALTNYNAVVNGPNDWENWNIADFPLVKSSAPEWTFTNGISPNTGSPSSGYALANQVTYLGTNASGHITRVSFIEKLAGTNAGNFVQLEWLDSMGDQYAIATYTGPSFTNLTQLTDIANNFGLVSGGSSTFTASNIVGGWEELSRNASPSSEESTSSSGGAYFENAKELNSGLIFEGGQWTPKP
jgi:hypothetical protein